MSNYPAESPNTPLASAFHFSPDDLRVNRESRLSGRQRLYLWRRFGLLAGGGILLILTPMFLTWGLVMWSTEQNLDEVVYDDRVWIGYLIAVLLGVMYVVANHKSLALLVDLLMGHVQEERGIGQVWGRYLKIGKHRFVIDDDALEMIQSGLQYRVFVLPLSSTLLSIEYAE